MTIETNYEFRRALAVVHRPNRRDHAIQARPTETMLDHGWRIVLPQHAPKLVMNAARDLQDYLLVSMAVSVTIEPADDLAPAINLPRAIILMEAARAPASCGVPQLTVPQSFHLRCTADQALIAGHDARGVMRGCHYLEDTMNLREAPLLERTSGETRAPLFSPRMTHSGWGIDQFPDAHLNAISHAGYDAIVVFAKGVDTTTHGYLDFNDLIARAAAFGLDVYFYSYLKAWKHPDDPDAPAFFDAIYGELFRRCPGARGVFLVGESCEFPSRDSRVNCKKWHENHYFGIPDPKPSPGWWPCDDYARWVQRVRDSVRGAAPAAEIIFCTYNWGWAPVAERVKLLETLPADITLLVPYGMFTPIRRGAAVSVVMDYTISAPGPGPYFESEAAVAKQRGLKLYALSNTCGMTWDFGAVPYIPVPYQWQNRFESMHACRDQYGLCGLMESHHFGWYPSPISEAAKWSFWTPASDVPAKLHAIAARDFGAPAAQLATQAWRKFSGAITHLTTSNEDQYGPFRVGPAYPFVFHPNITRTMGAKEIPLPTAPYAHFGGRIVKTFYQPYENINQSPAAVRMPAELAELEECLSLWNAGMKLFAEAQALAPAGKAAAAAKAAALYQFIRNSIITGIHAKRWWQLNMRLQIEPDKDRALKILADIETLARAEIDNARDTIPAVETDSRLGWEPSMEYVADRWHLEWKIRQVENVITDQIPAYRKMLNVNRDVNDQPQPGMTVFRRV